MRLIRAFLAVARLAGASGIGVYLGASVVGLVAVLSGHADVDRSWLATLPVLAVLGPLLGLAVGRLSRCWLLPRMRRRRWAFAAAGVVSLPFFAAFGDSPDVLTTGTAVALVGGVASAAVYLRACRMARIAWRTFALQGPGSAPPRVSPGSSRRLQQLPHRALR